MEELACFVLKSAGESVERKHNSCLRHLETLLEIHPIANRENIVNESAPLDDGYEVCTDSERQKYRNGSYTCEIAYHCTPGCFGVCFTSVHDITIDRSLY